jgi:hypothetical protein
MNILDRSATKLRKSCTVNIFICTHSAGAVKCSYRKADTKRLSLLHVCAIYKTHRSNLELCACMRYYFLYFKPISNEPIMIATMGDKFRALYYTCI